MNQTEQQQLIDELAGLPARLEEVIAGLSNAQLDTPYREGGWIRGRTSPR
jgi:hypothetical protein